MSGDTKTGEATTSLKKNQTITLLVLFLLVVIIALAVYLYLHPDIKDNPLFVALGFVATVFPCLYLVWQIRKPEEYRQEQREETTAKKVVDSHPGLHTNVTGGVQGGVLSGKFNGPAAAGGEAVDLRGSPGAIYKPTIQQREKLPVPRLQPPPMDFTGREEELGRLLSHFDRGATITGLRGTGGIGKTALALQLADKLKSRFADGQIFLKLEGMSPNPVKPADAMAQVIRAFRGSDERLPEDENELQRLYSSVLEGKSILLLLDNAADDKQVLPLMPPMSCAILVTSRKKFTLPGMPETFALDTLKHSEAQDLLLKICPRIGSHAEELAKLCGYLPLALRAAASLLAVKSDLNPSDYLEELRSENTRLEKIGKEGIDIDVEASLNLSYMRLPAEAASVFRQLSVFPSDFDAQAEEIVCQDEGHRNLSELVTWSLVEFLESRRYRLHDLARVFSDSRLKADAREPVQLRHAMYYQEVLWKATELFLHGGKDISRSLEQFDANWMNIRAGQKWAKVNMAISLEIAEICSNFARNNVILRLRMHPRENIEWLEAALVAACQTSNKNAEGAHLADLGLAHFDLGDSRKAIEYYERSWAIFRELRDYSNEGNVLDRLGLSHAALGDARKAIEFYAQALSIFREIENKRGKADTLGNLGNAYANLGDIKKAIIYYEEQQVITHQIEDRPGESIVLGNLGVAHAELGDTICAIKYFEQGLFIAHEIGNRHGEGVALTNLGLAHARQEDLKKAIELHLKALAIFSKIEDRPGEVNALGNLGLAYFHLGETRKAIEHYEQALIISCDIGDRRGEGILLFNMSLSLEKLGQRAKAIDLAKSALEIFEQIESPHAEIVRKALAKWQS
ncbi:MAG: tetratricopeptide repeat protein [Methanothrix sp.]|nr:tetratricopeptide repeat protein [Methanothrix sp.]